MPLAIELPDDLAEAIEARRLLSHPNEPVPLPDQVVTEDLRALYDLEEQARLELLGFFDRRELGYILDIANGLALVWPTGNLQHLLLQEVQDAARLGGLDQKWFGDDEQAFDDFQDKVRNHVRAFDAYVLLREAKLALASRGNPLEILAERLTPVGGKRQAPEAGELPF